MFVLDETPLAYGQKNEKDVLLSLILLILKIRKNGKMDFNIYRLPATV